MTLPAATGGDRTSYERGPLPLPRGLRIDEATRVLSGTPTEVFAQRRHTWTATDIDGESDSLSFTMEVTPALAAARERLRAVNESVLPELSRAMWGSVIDALTDRPETAGAPPGDGAGVMASGLAGASEFLRSNESALEAGSGSWRELLAGESFVLGVGSGSDGPGGGSPVTVWGSGDWRNLSLDDAAVDWSGSLLSAHPGVDAPLGGRVRGGVAVSWFESEIDYTDRRGEAAISGVHESRLPAVHPYAGWFGADGSRLWGALGYGMSAFRSFGAATPHVRYGQAQEGERRYGLDWRLARPAGAFDLGLEGWRRERGPVHRPAHCLRLDLRLPWQARRAGGRPPRGTASWERGRPARTGAKPPEMRMRAGRPRSQEARIQREAPFPGGPRTQEEPWAIRAWPQSASVKGRCGPAGAERRGCRLAYARL